MFSPLSCFYYAAGMTEKLLEIIQSNVKPMLKSANRREILQSSDLAQSNMIAWINIFCP